MSKIRLKAVILTLLPIILLGIIGFRISGTTTSYADDESYLEIDNSFEIADFMIEVEATADRQAHIKETITVEFLEPRASIYRDLPTNGGIEYRNITVQDRAYSVEKYGSFLAVDLDADNYEKSLDTRTYVLTYTLDYSRAIRKDIQDSIPLNVIGQGIPVKIHSATINITLPGIPIESYYYVGKRGETGGKERLDIVLDGKDILITTNRPLMPYEGITVGYIMPEGMMHKAMDYSIIWKTLLGLILAIVIYIVYRTKGKDEEITPVINFTAPKGMNPAEVGYLIDNHCSPEDMTSLIYYWASHNHLNIQEDDKNKLTLIRKEPLDDTHKDYEKLMYDSLFKSGDRVKVSSLQNNFYMTIETSSRMLRSGFRDKIFSKGEFILSIVLAAVAVFFVGLWSYLSGLMVSRMYSLASGFVGTGVATALIYLIGTLLFRKEPKILASRGKFYMLFYVLVGVVGFVLNRFLVSQFMPFSDAAIVVIIYSLMMLVIPFCQKRTDEYHKLLNELTGFKVFLLEAEKDRLEMLLKDNPQYYYDILPYANVLGVSKEWMDKFKDLTMERPTWYYSPRPFSVIVFNRSFIRTFNTMSKTMVSRPSSQGKSGGGFGGGMGGGGFSGGGFGGGGMRSR